MANVVVRAQASMCTRNSLALAKLPLFSTARGHFHVLGAPHYAVPDAVAGTHRSFIVVHGESPARRIGDLRGLRFAINEADSNRDD